VRANRSFDTDTQVLLYVGHTGIPVAGQLQRLALINALLRQLLVGSAFVLCHHLSAAQYVVCGLGPPPGSPDFVNWTTTTEQQRRNLGYLLICDKNLDRYQFQDQIAEDKDVRRRLAFIPRDLNGSAFSKIQFLSSIADGFGDRGAAMYRRVFRGLGGEVITLLEFSLRGGASIRFTRDDGRLRIRNTDAQLTVVQATSGKGFAELAWQENSIHFEVTINRGADNGHSKERLIGFAESLPMKR
jgi:hypothetical protein